MGRVQQARAWAAVAAIGACLIALAGWGGGGADNSSTSVNVMVPPITTGREGVRLTPEFRRRLRQVADRFERRFEQRNP